MLLDLGYVVALRIGRKVFCVRSPIPLRLDTLLYPLKKRLK